uniref:Uncharacterized protein n=1 Tax=Anguilla anguilla TaxID=7936 RepID=A0A0E9S3Z6_ANGAN
MSCGYRDHLKLTVNCCCITRGLNSLAGLL